MSPRRAVTMVLWTATFFTFAEPAFFLVTEAETVIAAVGWLRAVIFFAAAGAFCFVSLLGAMAVSDPLNRDLDRPLFPRRRTW